MAGVRKLIDLKKESDHAAAIRDCGGQVIGLDQITSGADSLDPVQFLTGGPHEGQEDGGREEAVAVCRQPGWPRNPLRAQYLPASGS